jgi:hypothetical protein
MDELSTGYAPIHIAKYTMVAQEYSLPSFCLIMGSVPSYPSAASPSGPTLTRGAGRFNRQSGQAAVSAQDGKARRLRINEDCA